jgi:hypothetical protein
VYNIEVEGDHCYRVGQQGLLVHNASMPSECRKYGLLPGESMNLVSQPVNVYYRTSLTATPASVPYSYLRVDKKVASLACDGDQFVLPPDSGRGGATSRRCRGHEDREPSTWMSNLVQYGLLAAPAGTSSSASPTLTLGRQGDHVGHIIGNQFGGYANETQGRGNVFPQHGRTNTGSYQTFETQTLARHVEHACEVCVLWVFAFDPGSSTPHRPTSVTVTYWADNTLIDTLLFSNPYP